MNDKARYIMIGGFLGAGKTTTIIKFAHYLKKRNRNAGLITNDQSSGLVDTAMVRKNGFRVEEIPGGCFCCKFRSLVEASERLMQDQKPDVFIAEPVGSCTDLVASVSYPLRRIYGNLYTIAPLSVLVDPIRARRILGLDSGPSFSSKVRYVYEKQLEEAEFIIINKSDLLNDVERDELKEKLLERFNPLELFVVSVREETGLDEWFEKMLHSEISSRRDLDLDYEIYADGEALLGWLNTTINLSSEQEFDGNEFTFQLANTLHHYLKIENLEIAHLKMTLTPDEGLGDIATVNLVRNDFTPELSEILAEPLRGGQLIINLRAEGHSERLHKIVLDTLNGVDKTIEINVEHIEHFQPGKPNPTHRMAEMGL